MKSLFLTGLAALLLCACNKAGNELATEMRPDGFSQKLPAGTETLYLIKKDQHSSTGSGFAPVALTELKFSVRFDSSAVYQSKTALNQLDINKLYGFSDNAAAHHQYSARFGWRWSDGALRLFAYVYNAGKVESTELGTIPIGMDVPCALRVAGNRYEFVVAEELTAVPRASTTAAATGYMLYPYFGGDETAPHDVRIWIRHF